MNTLFGQMVVLHNSNLKALGIMWPSDIFLALALFCVFLVQISNVISCFYTYNVFNVCS
jgi:hypothetical protein